MSSFVSTVSRLGLYERYRNIRTISIPKNVQNNIGAGTYIIAPYLLKIFYCKRIWDIRLLYNMLCLLP